MLDFEVLGGGQMYAVYLGEERVSPFCGSRDGAYSYIPGLERRRRRQAAQERPCISCGTVVHSEGPHHRMCNPCRAQV